MVRRVLLLLVGAVAGGAAVYLLVGSASRAPTATTPVAEIVLPEPAEPPATDNTTSGFASERLEVYAEAAKAATPVEIETLIQTAAQKPPSRLRDLELATLLARLAEIDPARAVEVARSRYLDAKFLEPLFEAWARRDADAALAALVSVRPASTQREIALAILNIIGNDEDGIDRVAAVLPGASRAGLEADAIVARAESDPRQAVRALARMDNRILQSLAYSRIAGIAGRTDPLGAIEQAGSIKDSSLRTAFVGAVLQSWADADPDAAFAWLERADPSDLPESTAVYQQLAAQDPDRLTALIDRMPPAVRSTAQGGLMTALAESDPMAALAKIDAMPAGSERDRMLQTIAQAYGRQSPDLAMAWAKSLPPAQAQTALRSVIQGIAYVDGERAVDLALAEIDGTGGAATPQGLAISSALSLVMIIGNADPERIVNKLIGRNDAVTRSALSTAVARWAQRDGQAALAWAVANAGQMDANSFRNIASQLASNDATLATSALNQVPPDKRAAWLEGLAGALAQRNIDQAMSLLNRTQNEPGYAAAYSAVVQRLATNDPVRAASMLSNALRGASGTVDPGATNAAFSVAREWARRDPSAAAAWAAGLENESIRTRSLNTIASTWAQRDADAARLWVLGLNRGGTRDAALDGFVQTTAQAGQFDAGLIDAYSTDAARQQGLRNAILQVGRTDRQQARQLLDRYVTDENVRRQIESNIDRMSGLGISNVPISSGIIF